MFDDHIVVESPGKLPGLVRADNIRFTHFSRNPKIAEFLKNYKFVKEFGEGVNRMCNELEQVGLKDPVYHTNAFMLQAVIYNSKVGKTIVEKTADSLKKLAVAVNKSLIDSQKPTIGENLRPVEAADIMRINRMMIVASLIALVLFLAVRCVLCILL